MNIGKGAFSGCSNLEKVEIPDGIKFIKDYTFTSCENLITIIIPQSVKEIGNLAFDSDRNLSNVLFKGSKSQWNSIDFSDGNTNLVESVIHYDVKFVEKKAPTCVNKGYDLYSCSECSDGVKINYTDPLNQHIHIIMILMNLGQFIRRMLQELQLFFRILQKQKQIMITYIFTIKMAKK